MITHKLVLVLSKIVFEQLHKHTIDILDLYMNCIVISIVIRANKRMGASLVFFSSFTCTELIAMEIFVCHVTVKNLG